LQKFQQIDSSLTRTRGGLGLAICKEISGLLGGKLRVESSPNKGSAFYFSIPLKPENKTSVPVIAQTAYAMKNDEKDAFDAGCSAHISKPIKISELKKTISEFLDIPIKKPLVI